MAVNRRLSQIVKEPFESGHRFMGASGAFRFPPRLSVCVAYLVPYHAHGPNTRIQAHLQAIRPKSYGLNAHSFPGLFTFMNPGPFYGSNF